ncbi:MAG: hypothetical protein L0H36_02770 [bacterium]|nr:hypothetical protein [bacterium]
MQYTFSFGAMFLGIGILIAGALFVRFHMIIADNFGGGLGSYEKYKMWGLIGCGVGMAIALNLHTLVLSWIAHMVFGI